MFANRGASYADDVRDAAPPPALGPRGEGWVALQGILLVAVAIVAVIGPPWPASVRGLSTVIAAAAAACGLVLAAAGSRRLGSALTPFPRPAASQTLRDDGVYRLVRHPIYGGVLLLSIGVTAWRSPWAVVPTALLALLFDRKRRREEAWLVEAYPGYQDYRRRVTHVFWPYVW